jgi:hypothetical protein
MATKTLENVTVSDAYLASMADRGVTEARQMLPALERAMKVVLVEKRQALLNVVCDVDTNAGGD